MEKEEEKRKKKKKNSCNVFGIKETKKHSTNVFAHWPRTELRDFVRIEVRPVSSHGCT